MKTRASKYFRTLVDIRPGEWSVFLLMSVSLFLVISTFAVVKPARSSLFLQQYGASRLPYVYIATALMAGVVATILSQLFRRFTIVRMQVFTYLFFATNLLFFWWAFRLDFPWLSAAFYLWVNIFTVTMNTLFWTLANNYYNAREAKRFYGLINSSGTIGGIVSGLLVVQLVSRLGTENLLLLCVGVLGGGVGVTYLISLLGRDRFSAREVEYVDSGSTELNEETRPGWAQSSRLFQSPYPRYIAAGLALALTISVIIEYQFNVVVEQVFLEKDAKTAFFSTFFVSVNALTFIFQFVLTGALLRRFGIGASLAILPVVMIVGSVVFPLLPILGIAVLLRISDSSLRYSIEQSTRDLLYLPIRTDVMKRLKVIIDVFVSRLAKGIGSILILVLTTGLMLGFEALSYITLGLAIVWAVVAILLRREYLTEIRRYLRRGRLGAEGSYVEFLDPETTTELLAGLDSGDEKRAIYCLSLLEQAPHVSLTDRLSNLLGNPSAKVRAATLRLLTARRDHSAIQAAEELVISDDPEVGSQAVHYLCQSDPNPNARLLYFLNHPDLDVRLAALTTAGEHPYRRPLPTISQQWIQDLMSRGDAEAEKARTLAARALVLADPQVVSVQGHLRRLLEDSNPVIVKLALGAAGKVQSRELIPLIVNKLPNRKLRAEAREALARLGSRIVGTLGDYLGDPNEREAVRRAIPRVLGQISTAEAAKTLIHHLPNSSLETRSQIIKALNQIRRDQPKIPIPGDIIDREVLREVKRYYQLLFSVHSEQAQPGPGRELLIRTLEERLDQTMERIFRLLGLRYPTEDIYDAYQASRSSKSGRRSGALDFLDNILERSFKRTILPVLEESSWDRLRLLGEELFGLEALSIEQSLRGLIRSDDRWLKIVALYRAAELQLKPLEAEMRMAEQDPDPVVVETAKLALAHM